MPLLSAPPPTPGPRESSAFWRTTRSGGGGQHGASGPETLPRSRDEAPGIQGPPGSAFSSWIEGRVSPILAQFAERWRRGQPWSHTVRRGPWPVALNSPPSPLSSVRDWNPTVTGCPVPSINSQAVIPTPAPARGPPLRRPRRRPRPGRSGARPRPTTPCRTLLPSRSVGSPTASCLRGWRQAKELQLTRRRRLGVFGPAWRAEGAGATGVPGEVRRGAQRDPPPQARELESRRAPGIWQRRTRGKRPEERPHLARATPFTTPIGQGPAHPGRPRPLREGFKELGTCQRIVSQATPHSVPAGHAPRVPSRLEEAPPPRVKTPPTSRGLGAGEATGKSGAASWDRGFEWREWARSPRPGGHSGGRRACGPARGA